MDGDKKHTVTKKQVITALAREKGLHPNEVRSIVQSFLDTLVGCLEKGERIEFRDFGIFEVVRRKKKIGRNPKNAQVPVIIPEHNAVKFTPGKRMKEAVESGFSSDS